MKTFLLLALSLVSFAVAHATPLDEKIKAYNDALMTATNGNGSRTISLSDANSDQLQGFTMEVRQTMASTPQPAVQKAGEDLLAEIKAEEDASRQAIVDRIDAVVARVPDLLAHAQKTSDLDGVLADIEAAKPHNNSIGGVYDSTLTQQMNRADQVYRFVSQWQDYLSQLNNGHMQDALMTLKALLNTQDSGASLMPRSKILDQINALESKTGTSSPSNQSFPHAQATNIDSILAGIHTLDDLEPAARQAMIENGQLYDSQRLNQLANRYAQAKNGLPISFDFMPNGNYGVTPQPGFARLDSMLLLYLLPRFLGAEAPAPNANESVDDYLDRITNAAESTVNLALLQRVLSAKGMLIRPGQEGQFQQGLQTLLSALNEELAGEYGMAVQSYQNALQSGDESLPAKFIGNRLTSIRKDHPDAFPKTSPVEFINPNLYRSRTPRILESAPRNPPAPPATAD